MPARKLTYAEFRKGQQRVARNLPAALLVYAVVPGVAYLLLVRFTKFAGGDVESILTFWDGIGLFIVGPSHRRHPHDVEGSSATLAGISWRLLRFAKLAHRGVRATFLQDTL